MSEPDDPNYYAVLEIPREADADTVKKAYRRLALKWHPDKNPTNKTAAEHQFKLVSEAYEVLSDPKKRQIYDTYGKSGLVGGGSAAQGSSSFNPADFGAFNTMFGFSPFGFHFRDPMDIFKEIFGTSTIDMLFSPQTDFGVNDRLRRSQTQRNSRQSPYHQHNQTTSHNRHSTQVNPYNANMGSDLMGSMLGGFFGGGLFPGMFDMNGMQSSTSVFNSGFGGGGGNFRTVSSSSRYINGNMVKTTTIVENGTETVTEEINGQVTNQTVRHLDNRLTN